MAEPGKSRYYFYRSGSARSFADIIGIEYYQDGKLVGRNLYKGGDTKHGIQREWYPNGQLKSVQPYKDGQMNGVFQMWDEKGQLISQDTIDNGNGIQRIFDDDGVLVKERQYVNGSGVAFSAERYSLGNPSMPPFAIAFDWEAVIANHQVGYAYNFFSTGELEGTTNSAPDGTNGPVPDYYVPSNSKWYIHGKSVTPEEYAAAAAQDPSLPPYFADVRKYKDYFVTPELWSIFLHYLNMPRVKIPLEFDAQGRYVLAPDQPGANPDDLMAPPPPPPAPPNAAAMPGYAAAREQLSAEFAAKHSGALKPVAATVPKPTPAKVEDTSSLLAFITPWKVAIGIAVLVLLFLGWQKRRSH